MSSRAWVDPGGLAPLSQCPRGEAQRCLCPDWSPSSAGASTSTHLGLPGSLLREPSLLVPQVTVAGCHLGGMFRGLQSNRRAQVGSPRASALRAKGTFFCRVSGPSRGSTLFHRRLLEARGVRLHVVEQRRGLRLWEANACCSTPASVPSAPKSLLKHLSTSQLHLPQKRCWF